MKTVLVFISIMSLGIIAEAALTKFDGEYQLKEKNISKKSMSDDSDCPSMIKIESKIVDDDLYVSVWGQNDSDKKGQYSALVRSFSQVLDVDPNFINNKKMYSVKNVLQDQYMATLINNPLPLGFRAFSKEEMIISDDLKFLSSNQKVKASPILGMIPREGYSCNYIRN